MRIPFKLEATESITPNSAATLARDLMDAARILLITLPVPQGRVADDPGAVRVAILWNLAADAYEAGATAATGHNRAERYREDARQLRQDAHNLMQGTY